MSAPLSRLRNSGIALASVLALAFAGCAGLPSLQLPDRPNAAGTGSEQGESEGGLKDGSSLADEQDAAGDGPRDDPVDAAATGTVPGLAGATDDLPQPTELVGWLVRFRSDIGERGMRAFAAEMGATYVLAFKSLPMAYLLATEDKAARMAKDPRAAHVERDAAIEFFDTESRQAIRQHLVIDPVTGLKDAAGNPVDGRGIGVAVVDTGINALHADLPYTPMVPGGVVVSNLKVESLAYVPMANTDTTSGHGTHVAAIVAGKGAGNAAAKGVAPAAKLYGFGVGEASTILWAAQAFDWIVQNHNAVSPPIKVVTNSWGSGTAYDPNSAITQFVNLLVDRDIAVVFAAGNAGGDGSVAKTSAQCQIPRPGVICVAAFDDLDTGTRDGDVAPYSSRGASAQSSTWPDISAPGSRIYSARPVAGSTTGMGILDPNYVNLSGTSAAAPHVAGILALMLQKHPTWSPATLETKLKCTAYKFTDGAAYSSASLGGCSGATSSYDKGFGLADAYSAVSAT